MELQGINFTVVRVDGDPKGEKMPDRILLRRKGITAEYVLTVAADVNCKIVQTGTWEDCR